VLRLAKQLSRVIAHAVQGVAGDALTGLDRVVSRLRDLVCDFAYMVD
jgi:hypothetical protein